MAGLYIYQRSTMPYCWHMRTTLDIDDELLGALMEQLPTASKTEAIETAIEAYVSHRSVARLRELAGTVDVEDLSTELRRSDRTT